MDAVIGRKIGMTRVFTQDGSQVPVTVIEGGPCMAVQRKTVDQDGYDAVQLGFGSQKESRLGKPMAGHLKKAGVEGVRVLREIRVSAEDETAAGDTVGVSVFDGISYVDVVATSKGRGTQGVMKRHGFHGGRKTHGSHSKRRPGSIGQCEFPARVFKGKRMAGQMGSKRVTTQNLKVVQVRADENVLLVQGAVPGPNGGMVLVRKAIKKGAQQAAQQDGDKS